MSLPRLVVLMGSGETSPTMVRTHRDALARLGPPPVTAALLDTPYGFQSNADDLTARALAYFAESVGQEMAVASFRSAVHEGTVDYERAMATLRAARYVFAGPGSPTYALRQWRDSSVPALLREKLSGGGCVSFASAAALTLGVSTVPVYEIYKVGEAPHWAPGLDLLAEAGLRVAVVPHYDNAEGGTHDTRFCYLGEERLAAMEALLPEGAFVLGIDEHTGCLVDLDEETATVVGLGGVTVRASGHSATLPSGAVVPLAELVATAESLRSGVGTHGQPAQAEAAPSAAVAAAASSPLLETVGRLERDFDDALGRRDAAAAVQAVLDLDAELRAWASETFAGDEEERARAALRSMIVRLGDVAGPGLRDPRETVGPFVEALLAVRSEARRDRRWHDADRVRDALLALDVDVRDTPDGSHWELGSGG